MDDAAQKREARRRRILENSQKRLEKITGVEQKSAVILPEIPQRLYHEPQPVVPQEEVRPIAPSVQPPQRVQTVKNKTRDRIIVIAALAVFIDFYMILLSPILKDAPQGSPLKSVFGPLIAYEVIEFFYFKPQSQNSNFILNLLFAYVKSNRLLPVFQFLMYFATLFQDVMLYFFIYVCCQFVKQLFIGVIKHGA